MVKINIYNMYTKKPALASYLMRLRDVNALPTSYVRFTVLTFFVSSAPNTCQNRRVSSPAADATVYPVNSAIFIIDGYFHRHIWFLLNLCKLMISFSCLLQCSTLSRTRNTD